jgi:hypothetical protein
MHCGRGFSRERWCAELIHIVGSVVEGSHAPLPPSGRQMAIRTALAGLIVIGSLAKQC